MRSLKSSGSPVGNSVTFCWRGHPGTVEGPLVPEPWKRRNSAGADVQGPVTETSGDTLAFCPTLFQQEPIQTAENSRRGWVPRETQSGEDSTHVCLRPSLWLQLPTRWPAWNPSFAHVLQRPSPRESLFDTRSGSCLLPVAPSYPHRMAAFTFSHVVGGKAHSRLPHSSPSP